MEVSMLTLSRMKILVGVLILLAYPVQAQESTAQNATLIRQSIEQLEKLDIRSKSAQVQSIYKRTLLRKYGEYISALQQDIAEIKQIQAGANTPGAPPDQEASNLLKQLSEELSLTSEKASTLRADLKLPASPDSRILQPSEVAAISEASAAETEVRPRVLGDASPRPALDGVKRDFLRAAAPPANRDSAGGQKKEGKKGKTDDDEDETAQQGAPKTLYQIGGTVTVINAHFFTNPEKFTPSQIKYEGSRSKLGAIRNERSDAQSQSDRVQKRVNIILESELPKEQKARSTAEVNNLVLKDEYVNKFNTPLSGATVSAVQFKPDGGKDVVKTTKTGRDGNYILSLEPGDYVITADMGGFTTEEPVSIVAPAAPAAWVVPQVDLQLIVRPLGEFARAIVGLEQAGASSAKSSQKYFFDLTLSAPLPLPLIRTIDPFFGQRARVWGTVRVTSVPQQLTAPVGQFAAQFAQEVSKVKVNEVAQAIEFLAGGEIRLTKKWINFGSFDGKTTNKFNLSFIFGGGAITPTNPRDTLEVFKIFPGAAGLPEIPAGKEFIAFVSPDRDRFFRQFYAGFRAHGYYFDYKNPDIPLKRYPATLDVTFGMNESVTGGRLRGGVLRLEGFYPLPYNELEFVNLFGTAIIKPTRTRIQDPLILEPAPSGTTVPASNVFLVTVPQINRDYYRVGVGIDVISLIKKLPPVSNK
jgi:hypothetical protein